MKIEFVVLLIILVPLVAYRIYRWSSYVKNRKYSGSKLKKYADKMNSDKNTIQ